MAGQLARLELVLHHGPCAVANQVALVMGDAGFDLKEQLVLGGAWEGAALGREVRGDPQLPDRADGVQRVTAQAVLFGGYRTREEELRDLYSPDFPATADDE